MNNNIESIANAKPTHASVFSFFSRVLENDALKKGAAAAAAGILIAVVSEALWPSQS